MERAALRAQRSLQCSVRSAAARGTHAESRRRREYPASSACELRALPPALVIVDENDILRDEGEQYARKLIEAGVDVTPLRVLATHHDYALLNALADTPATRVTIELVSEKLNEALGASRQKAAA
ncbi:MAG: alpha/beta hydrolase fold domain-containing protein [Longimicrobiales bacterium]